MGAVQASVEASFMVLLSLVFAAIHRDKKWDSDSSLSSRDRNHRALSRGGDIYVEETFEGPDSTAKQSNRHRSFDAGRKG